jgi:hypothetical protein
MSSDQNLPPQQPQLPNIPPPGIPAPGGNLSKIPDPDTAKGFDYAADERAENRILHIHTKWFHYGTDDKGHAAALVLSAALLATAIVVALLGCLSLLSGKDPQWFQTLVTWIGNAFLFTAGIAVGKSASNKRD